VPPEDAVLNLPNTLTLLRIVAIPVFLIALTGGHPGTALIVFLAAGMTDAVDGALARLMDQHTEFGATFDPLADKLLMVSAFAVLAWSDVVATWLTIIVLTREAVLLLGFAAIYLISEPIQVRPSLIGKANTFFQLFTVGFALLTLARPDLPMREVNLVTQGIAAATTAASGVQYVYRGLLWQQTHPQAES